MSSFGLRRHSGPPPESLPSGASHMPPDPLRELGGVAEQRSYLRSVAADGLDPRLHRGGGERNRLGRPAAPRAAGAGEGEQLPLDVRKLLVVGDPVAEGALRGGAEQPMVDVAAHTERSEDPIGGRKLRQPRGEVGDERLFGRRDRAEQRRQIGVQGGPGAGIATVDRFELASTAWRAAIALAMALTSFTIYDLLGRTLYSWLMTLNIVSVGALGLFAGLAYLRRRALA